MDRKLDNKFLRYALQYAEEGIGVFPIAPRQKKPPLVSNGVHDASTDPQQIRSWWQEHPDANVGLATGRVFVIDLDVGEEKDGRQTWTSLVADKSDDQLSLTTTVKTPGGVHLYYRAPDDVTIKNSVSELGEGIDVRGHDGYVVAPPSVRDDGKYEFVGADLTIAEAPPWLVSKVRESRPNGVQYTGHSSSFNAPDEIPEGKRNDTIFRIACQLREKPGMSESELRPTIHLINKNRCSPPLGSDEVDKIVNSVVSRYDRGDHVRPIGGDGKPATSASLNQQKPEEELTSYEPFPVETFPPPIRDYVRSSTRALGEEVPPAMVAVPTLSVLSGAVGDAAHLELKRSWTEPATLWTVLVAPSGSTKSPAFEHAVRPVLHRESEANEEHERAVAEWKSQDDSDPQEKPTRKRFRTGDATPEAVVKILEDNPQGVLLARDELGAWIGSFDRYVNGTADLQFWVEVWQGVQASRDRAGEGNTTIDTPVVPVTGTIQPGTLKEKLDDIHFDTGFAARLVLCQPPTPAKRWTEADVSREVRRRYERLLTRLFDLEQRRTVSLSSKAKTLWVDYYDSANADLEAHPEGPAKAVLAKGITHTARLALIFHLSRRASSDAQLDDVDAESMEAALRVGQWLTKETLRVYRKNNLGAKAKPPIRHFFDKLPDRFKTSEAKEIAQAQEIPESTMYKWMSDLRESGDLEKIRRGLYRKT